MTLQVLSLTTRNPSQTDNSFSNLMNSNHPPLGLEEEMVRETLRGAKCSILALDAKIFEARNFLDNLLKSRRELDMYIKKHEAVLSPIRRMPPEILSDIFLAFVQMSATDILTKKDGVWLLGQICSRWRYIVWSSPQLWAYINITHGTLRTRADDCCVLQAILNRTAACQLSINFHSARTEDIRNPLLDLLMCYSERWEEVTLYMSLSLYQSLAPIHGKLSSLRILHLSVHSNWSSEAVIAFEHAPNLSRLTFSGWKDSSQTVLLPWEQLISYDDDNPYEILDVLQKATNLRKLSFAVLSLSGNSLSPRHTREINVAATCLETLNVRGMALPDLLGSLHLPALQDISIDQLVSHYDHTKVIQSLQTCLQCPSTLRVLHIGQLEKQDAQTLINILRETRSLTTISIDSWISEELLKILNALRGFELLPHLHTISLQRSNLRSLIYDLVEVIDSRWNPPIRPWNSSLLREINILTFPVEYRRAAERLAELMIDGLNIHCLDTSAKGLKAVEQHGMYRV